ncbi:hypothetical protein V8F20_005395 [Naviculisporaceae sp. PSN 640]
MPWDTSSNPPSPSEVPSADGGVSSQPPCQSARPPVHQWEPSENPPSACPAGPTNPSPRVVAELKTDQPKGVASALSLFPCLLHTGLVLLYHFGLCPCPRWGVFCALLGKQLVAPVLSFSTPPITALATLLQLGTSPRNPSRTVKQYICAKHRPLWVERKRNTKLHSPLDVAREPKKSGVKISFADSCGRRHIRMAPPYLKGCPKCRCRPGAFTRHQGTIRCGLHLRCSPPAAYSVPRDICGLP